MLGLLTAGIADKLAGICQRAVPLLVAICNAPSTTEKPVTSSQFAMPAGPHHLKRHAHMQ